MMPKFCEVLTLADAGVGVSTQRPSQKTSGGEFPLRYYTSHGWLDRLFEPLMVQGLAVVRESLAANSPPTTDSLNKDGPHEH